MRTRVIAVALIKNQQGEYLILKQPENFGQYRGQWGIVGGGLEDEETIEQAVEREVREEVNLKVISMKPLFFSSDRRMKLLRDGTEEDQYMLFLIHEVLVEGKVEINDEWSEFKWVKKADLADFDLNRATRAVFERLKLI